MGSRTGNGREDHSRRAEALDQEVVQELSPRLESQALEKSIYEKWEAQNCFHADPNSEKKPFTIVIPPPNVTGVLHMGHALDNTLQDILIRYKRMDGFEALWMPGTDHAGIATQAVVEKQIEAEGSSRKEMGREKFVERVWKWKEESGGKIIHQLKRLGASCDWERERFTLDPGLSEAVKKVFVQLYQEGLIYRSSYLVNWSPKLQSAISDLEVDFKEVQGFLYYFKYELKDGTGAIEVATTRPETLLGDVAVAVNPEDERYKHLVGKKLKHPFVDRDMVVIADDYVDSKFGTGAVKITPAHDPNDYEMGQRHQLEMITIMDKAGNIDCPESEFHGMERFAARKAIVKALEEKNLLIKKEAHPHSVGHCQRTGVVIEPRISKQWFVKIESLAKPAIEAVKSGDVKFVPENWSKTYLNWMENIRDWCISRQLWWGHQIPVWHCQACQHENVSETTPENCSVCKSSDLIQDPDVLDTWFSSGLWPFSTMGWPENTPELQKFYPTSVLVTGFDIIFFWVARMMMMALKFTNKAPFHTIHIHALIRDENGQKMSKSKGNVVDPIDMMDKYGTDAFRFAMTAFAAQGRDILLSEKRIEGYRNFITKLWNASRFATQKLELPILNLSNFQPTQVKSLSNRWILSRLNNSIAEVRKGFDEQRFNEAAQALYQFTWNDLCDWYIELIKIDLESETHREETQFTLAYVLDQTYRLMHPISPFVTEQLWQTFFTSKSSEATPFLMHQAFPKANKALDLEQNTQDVFQAFQELTEQLRNFRSENNIPPKKHIASLDMSFANSKVNFEAFAEHIELFQTLCKIDGIQMVPEIQEKSNSSTILGPKSQIKICVPWEGLIDMEAEKSRIEKQLKKWQDDAAKLLHKCKDERFMSNAPAPIVKKAKEDLERAEKQIEQLTDQLKQL